MKFYYIVPFILQKLIWIPTRLILVVCGSLKVEGLENLKGIQTPVIFACNHSSDIDPFMMPASLPLFSRFSPLFYAIREKTFYESKGWKKHLFNTWFIKMWGGYIALTGLRDYEKSLSHHIAILREGGSFCVFPEGSITREGQTLSSIKGQLDMPTNGKIQPAKGGISFLAHSAPCAIIPVAISGVYGMSPLGFFLRKRKITVRLNKPIVPTELYSHIEQPHTSGESVWKKEADYIMKKVAELIEK